MEAMEHHIKFILSVSNMFYTLIYHPSEESMTEKELGNLSPYKEAPILIATLFCIANIVINLVVCQRVNG